MEMGADEKVNDQYLLIVFVQNLFCVDRFRLFEVPTDCHVVSYEESDRFDI